MVFEYILRTDTPPHQVYKLHQEVTEAVYSKGHGIDKEAVRPLWRSIQNGHKGSIILIRSSERPFGINTFKEHVIRLESHQVYKFNTRLNASQRWRVEDSTRTSGTRMVEKCIGLTELNDWLRQLLSKNGLELQNAVVTGQAKLGIKKNVFANATDIIFYAKVTDQHLAEQAYNRGIGRMKAFGFGLLLEVE